MVLMIFLGVAAGIFTFIQTTINSRLRGHVQSPYLSSLISFFIGTVLLGIINVCSSGHLLPSIRQIGEIPWWMYLGGFLGMIVMTIYILLFPVLGGVQTVAMPIFGQIIMSMIIDNFGWFGVEKQTLNVFNIIGIIVLIVGVITVVMLPDYFAHRKNLKESEHGVKNKWVWQLTAILAGMMLAIQVAVNGNLGVRLQSPMQSAFIALGIGTVILVIINICQRAWKNITLFKNKKTPWWIWVGGIFGAIYIFLSAFLAPKIGTGSVVVFALIGQMTSSLCVDNFGLLGAAKHKVSAVQIIGLVIMLVGVAAIKIS